MAEPVANISFANTSLDTFQTWILQTNQIAYIISSRAVTVNGTANGAITSGNAYVNGYLSSLYMYANTIYGGNLTSNGYLTLGSNTNIVGTTNTITINANTINSNNIVSINSYANIIYGGVIGTPATLTVGSNTNINGTTNTIIINSNTVSANIGTFANVNSNNVISNNVTVVANTTLNVVNSVSISSNTITSNNATLSNTVINGNNSIANTLFTFANGSVGINTVNPPYTLTVNGTSSISGNVVIGGNLSITGNLVYTVTTTSDYVPTTGNVYSIGNSINNWLYGYFYGGVIFPSARENSAQTTTATVSPTMIDTTSSTYSAFKYLINVKNGSAVQTTEILINTNGANVSYVEYGTIYSNTQLATFTSNIVLSNTALWVTPSYANTTTYTIHKISIV